jgi:hypothetical protein
VVDQLLNRYLPFLERERREPVVLERGFDLVVAAIDAKPGDAAGGGIPHDLRGP